MEQTKLVDMWSLREEARKYWQYKIMNTIVYLGQVKDAHSQTISGAAKDYIERRLWCELHLCFGGERHYHYVCIIESEALHLDSFRELQIKSCALRWDDPMFVDITKFIQHPENISFIAVPSVVRLKQLDFVSGIGRDISGNTFEPSQIFRGLFVDDGKLRSVVRTVSGGQGKLPGDLIQGGTKVVNGIACDYGELGINDGYFHFNEKELPVNLFFCGDLRGFSINELSKFNVQNIEVFFRPFDLQLRIFETRLHMLKYPQGDNNAKDTKDAKGARDTRAQKARLPRQPKEGSQALNYRQTEEVKSRTSPSPRSGGYISKNTRSSRTGDV